MAKNLKEINVVDLESTCWKNEADQQGQPSEIIEIGIVKLDTYSFEVIRKDSFLVKPQFSQVSDFCTELTTITPDMLKDAPSFPETLKMMKKLYDLNDATWGSYGDYDRVQMDRNCNLYKVKNPFGRSHINIKNLFALKNKLEREVGMDTAIKIIGAILDGTHHRGLDDALNICKIYRSIIM